MTIPVIWLTKLLLSHLLTDFVLQPRKWVNDRMEKHFKSPYLYCHTFLTAILAWIFIGREYWQVALVIFITHTLIDGWKSYQPARIGYFLLDQLLHVLVIFGCWLSLFYEPDDIRNFAASLGANYDFWIITTAFVFLGLPAGILIGQLTKQWSDKAGGAGLANAGKWIGMLERMIILIFLLQHQYGAIGLLITAKGLLRFSEKDRQEEKTEYVLIGSLMSVGLSVVTGIIVQYLVEN